MRQDETIRRGRDYRLALHADVVFVTEHRHPVFAAAQPDRMEEIMGAVCADSAAS